MSYIVPCSPTLNLLALCLRVFLWVYNIVECDDAGWNMVSDWWNEIRSIGIQYEICEKIRRPRRKKNSISSLKLVVCGEIWFHSFYNFLPFFPFYSFALLIYFHWRHSLDIFLSFLNVGGGGGVCVCVCVFFCASFHSGRSLLFYIINNTLQNVWWCHVFNISDKNLLSSVFSAPSSVLEYLRKGVFLTYINAHNIQYILFIMYLGNYISIQRHT